jgi:hypothetical protein
MPEKTLRVSKYTVIFADLLLQSAFNLRLRRKPLGFGLKLRIAVHLKKRFDKVRKWFYTGARLVAGRG